MNQKLVDVGPVRLVWRRLDAELYGADDAPIVARGEQDDFSALDPVGDCVKERARLVMRVRRHEAHRGAALDAVHQDGGELVERGTHRRGIQLGNDDGRTHAARSSLEATVESGLSR